jgi:hypothetical protein
MDAILRKVLRFMRDARLCQVFHTDGMDQSGPVPILLPMGWSLSVMRCHCRLMLG